MNRYNDETDSEFEESDTWTTQCGHCEEEIYEDAERCPHCGNYVTSEAVDDELSGSRMFTRQPIWVIVTALLLAYAMLHAYLWPLLQTLMGTLSGV